MEIINIRLIPSEVGRKRLERVRENSIKILERLKKEMKEGKFDNIIKEL